MVCDRVVLFLELGGWYSSVKDNRHIIAIHDCRSGKWYTQHAEFVTKFLDEFDSDPGSYEFGTVTTRFDGLLSFRIPFNRHTAEKEEDTGDGTACYCVVCVVGIDVTSRRENMSNGFGHVGW
jgi:hypothetical protein